MAKVKGSLLFVKSCCYDHKERNRLRPRTQEAQAGLTHASLSQCII